MFRMLRIIFVYTDLSCVMYIRVKHYSQQPNTPNIEFDCSPRSEGTSSQERQVTLSMKPTFEGFAKIAVEATLSHAGAFLGSRRILYSIATRKENGLEGLNRVWP